MSGLVDRAREPSHPLLIMRRVRGRARLYVRCRLGLQRSTCRDARRRRRPAGVVEPSVPHGHSRVAAVWAKVAAGARLQLVSEPTRNAWMPWTAWFRARGATVILLPRRCVAETERRMTTTTHGYPCSLAARRSRRSAWSRCPYWLKVTFRSAACLASSSARSVAR
jgi:hypothetical protein